MKKSFQLLGCLALIATPLIAMPTHAEQWQGNGGWTADHDEMEGMRIEHEQLEAETDRLKMECMDAKGQGRSSCEEQSKSLQMRKEALHQRMEAMHQRHEYRGDENRPAPQPKPMKKMKKAHHDEWKKKQTDTPHHADTHKTLPTHKAPPQDGGSDNGDSAPNQ